MNLKRSVLVGMAAAMSLLFVGCGDEKEVAEFNKPALYWYQKIAGSITSGNLDKADAYYISLKSEHMRSPLMPTSLMMLAHAHMNAEEYLLANYYLDEYNKRFGEYESREYTDFMKLKASFLGIKDVYKDQKLIIDSIAAAKVYINRYPGSPYAPLVNTMLIRLHMSQYLLNENIAALYDRTGKEEAAKIYREKNKGSVVEMTDITPPEKGIIGYVFD
ncbi:outer membrane protein assembly factor BamD [Sulfurovum sp. TSL1]|uniref:outer membrane protein assembly factor BamD n=1 Tax=Sulfurovum sp. TSL1 TaxID=2826994 RepID=UPI001CC5D50C|nr:outer membrane protein assembly factor BamD [Sulfurovum sp. TSL1]GIT98413.1 outer membrane protein assembly factor BamD [Sulfurovum sp. TSL1]